MPLAVLMPIYNDWSALTMLIPEIDRALASDGRVASIVVADDGSDVPPPFGSDRPFHVAAITGIEVIHLRHNIGHQRAIAIGLAYVEAHSDCDAVVVMDGDGEDRPTDIPRLLKKLNEEHAARVVFAERRRRSEGVLFASLYWLYRTVHWLATGERVRVGNFSVIPRSLLRRLVAVSDLWNHYAAAVFHARIPFVTLPTSRGTRYAGRSHMNFVALVTHGLSAMSVFGDRIGVRLLITTAVLAGIAVVTCIGLMGWQIAIGGSGAGWTLFAGSAILLVVCVLLATSLGFVFIMLAGRNNSGFLPFLEFTHYVSHTSTIPVLPLDVQ